jgi:hypothetical protein
VFLREDIAAILAAIALISNQSDQSGPHAAAYRRGINTTLAALATALHISPAELAPPGPLAELEP